MWSTMKVSIERNTSLAISKAEIWDLHKITIPVLSHTNKVVEEEASEFHTWL